MREPAVKPQNPQNPRGEAFPRRRRGWGRRRTGAGRGDRRPGRAAACPRRRALLHGAPPGAVGRPPPPGRSLRPAGCTPSGRPGLPGSSAGSAEELLRWVCRSPRTPPADRRCGVFSFGNTCSGGRGASALERPLRGWSGRCGGRGAAASWVARVARVGGVVRGPRGGKAWGGSPQCAGRDSVLRGRAAFCGLWLVSSVGRAGSRVPRPASEARTVPCRGLPSEVPARADWGLFRSAAATLGATQSPLSGLFGLRRAFPDLGTVRLFTVLRAVRRAAGFLLFCEKRLWDVEFVPSAVVAAGRVSDLTTVTI